MKPVDYIIIGVLLLIAAGAGFAIYKSKKSGKKCIGCPDSGICTGDCPAAAKNKTKRRSHERRFCVPNFSLSRCQRDKP